MLNPRLNKSLIINPTKEQAKNLVVLDPVALLEDLVLKVAGGTDRVFKPMVTNYKHISMFISNVSPIVRSLQKYTGKELNSLEEAMEFFAETGRELYGPAFGLELVKHEIQLEKTIAFGLYTKDDKETIMVSKALDGFCDYSANPVEAKTTKPQKENKKTEIKEGEEYE